MMTSMPSVTIPSGTAGRPEMRTSAADIRVIGRNTQGVRVVKLDSEDGREQVASVALVADREAPAGVGEDTE